MPHMSYDILKTIAGKYQVIRINDNTTMGPTFFTRADAERHMQSLYDEAYGVAMPPEPVDENAGSIQEQAERNRNKPSKGVIAGTPGTDTTGDKKVVK